jgi:hypothetical protein
MTPGGDPGAPAPARLYWGPEPAPTGWIRLVGPEGAAPDLQGNLVADGLPLPAESLECAVCQIEPQALDAYSLLAALREIARVLKAGAVLRLGFIDLDKAIDAYREGRTAHFWCTEWSSLGGNFVTQVLEHNRIRTPLTREFARELLEAAGLADVRFLEPGRTTSAHGDLASFDRRPEEASFAEGRKRSGPRAARPPGPAEQVHLSWTEDPATTLTVMWSTPAGEGESFAEHRAVGGAVWARAAAVSRPCPGEGVLHQATLRGLAPGTEYEYRVVGDGGAGPAGDVFRTRTAPLPGPADFSFAFLCDTGVEGRRDGNATGARRVRDEVLADRPLFVLGGGDYAYADRDGRFADVGGAIAQWFRQMEPLLARVPFLPQYGNHEVFLGERFRDWAPRFAHPETWGDGRSYSFDVGDVHLTGLNVPGPLLTPDLLDALDRDLEAARARGRRWLIVWQHKPLFACGRCHPADPRVREALAPIFARRRVDLHLSGHDQSYERTHALRIERDCISWAAPGLEGYRAGSGVIYAKVSPGGKKSDQGNDFSRFTRARQPWMAARDDSGHHYALVTARAAGELAFQGFRVPEAAGPKESVDSFRVVNPAAGGRGPAS